MWLNSSDFEFKDNNILEITVTIKNIAPDKSFFQPSCLSLNEQTTCDKIKLIALPDTEGLSNAFGSDEVLSPNEKTTRLTFKVTHQNQPFSFSVDAHASDVPEDSTPPQITNITPIDNATISNAQPLISANYSDIGSGINLNSLSILLDGNNIVSEANVTESSFSFTPGQPLLDGVHTLSISVQDNASNQVQVAVSFTIETAPALGSIGNRNIDLGSTLRFTVTASDPNNDEIALFVTPLPLPDNATFNCLTGQFTFAPDETQAGSSFDLTFIADDGILKDTETIRITVNEIPINGVTALTGRILDTNDFVNGVETPVVGATVSILGTNLSATSASTGNFTLKGVPAGSQVLNIETSTANPAPNGSSYAGFREEIELIENVTNDVDRSFFLPRIAQESMTTVDPNTTTMVENLTLGVVVEVPPSTAMAEDGTLFTGELSISEVPEALAPAALPDTLDPGLLITIQPVGVVFDTPIPLTFPNIDNLPPGSELDLWSLDAEIGEFIIVGKGQVVADGSVIETIEGGVRRADWHTFMSPSGASGGPGSGSNPGGGCNMGKKSNGDNNGQWGSEVGVASGALIVDHTLPDYKSLGQSKEVRLVYNSLNADPQPVIVSNTTIPFRAAIPPTISTNLTVGGVELANETFTDTSGLNEDIDETLRQVIQLNAGNVDTGVYQYQMALTSNYDSSSISSALGGYLIVNNQQNSVFGAGWMLSDIDRLHVQDDGSALIVEGDGGSKHFSQSQGTIFIEENGWSLTNSVNFTDGAAAHYNPIDGLLYVERDLTESSGGGLYRIETNGDAVLLASGDRIAAIVIDHDDGDIFMSEDFDEDIHRTGFGDMTSTIWTSGFHSGYDDPVGMAIAPNDYTGTVINPGGALVVDRGFNGVDDIWGFSPDTAEGEFPVHRDNGTLVDPLDITIGRDEIYLVDGGGTGNPGKIYRLDVGGVLKELVTSEELNEPFAIATDPTNQDLLVLDTDSKRIVRIDPATGEISNLFVNFNTVSSWAGLDVSPDGNKLIVTDDGDDVIYIFEKVHVFNSPPGDFSTLVKNEDKTFTRTLKDGTKINFNTDGFQTSVVDRNGNTTTYAYDTDNNLSTITDPAGLITTLTYSNGLLESITDPAGRITTIEHDLEGNLRRITDPDASIRLFTYDNRHHMITQTSKRGFITEYTYDFTGRNVSVKRQDDSINKIVPAETVGLFDLSSGIGSETNPAPIVRPEEAITTFTDGNGNISTFRTDNLGLITESSDACCFGRITSIERDSNGLPVKITKANGAITTMTYDDKGNLLTSTDESIGATTIFAYDPIFNQVASITDPNKNVKIIEFDGNGNPIKVTDVENNEDIITYNTQGLLATITNALKNKLSIDYNDELNPDTITDPLGNITTLGYDKAGNVESITYAKGRVTQFVYDEMNKPRQMLDANSGISNFDYDENGNLVQIMNTNGDFTTFEYDTMERVIKSTDPLGKSDIFEYDDNGNLVLTIDRNGQSIKFEYDGVNQLIQKTLPGDLITTYDYNEVGDRVKVEDPDSNLTFTYDDAGRLASASTVGSPNQPGSLIKYTYDDNGNRLSMTDPTGQTGYVYDALNRIKTITSPSGQLTTFDYDALGRRTGKTLPNNVTTINGYDNANQLLSIVHQLSGNVNPISRFSYGYNETGNRSTLDHVREALSVSSHVSYTYDALDRLTQASNILPSRPVETFTYDAVGNRIVRNGQTQDAAFDVANRLISDEDFTYSYDGNGNLIKKTSNVGGGETILYI